MLVGVGAGLGGWLGDCFYCCVVDLRWGLVVLVCMICLCLLCELLCVSFLIVCCYSSVCADFGCCFAVGIGLLLDCG